MPSGCRGDVRRCLRYRVQPQHALPRHEVEKIYDTTDLFTNASIQGGG